MDLVIEAFPAGEKTVAVYRALRAAIVDGRLPRGHRLPATRTLAIDLGVSRGSVATAYERLVAEGYLTSRVGSGTFVASVAASRPARAAAADPLRPRRGWAIEPAPASADTATPRYDFRTGIPDARLFPFDTWRRLVAAEMRPGANHPGVYAGPEGHPALRAAIARYLGYARSVRVSADDVVVTNGTQHALDLVARVLLRAGDVVAVEEPGYPPPRRLFEALGCRVVGVPVDEEGLVVTALPAGCRLVYATPSHQFPLGRAMSLARRRELLDWAARRPVAIVEDDYDSEFRFSARPLEPLFSLDEAGRVIYAGTFSKSMIPAVRTGFVLVPPGLRAAVAAARQLNDGYGSPPLQAALARFIDEGLLARHVRRAGRNYGRRHAEICAHLSAMPELEVLPASAGLHVTALLRRGHAAPVVAAAGKSGLAIEDLGRYATSQEGFVVGFGAIDPALIGEGMAIFAGLLARHA
ncbi:PLP-dependent aminotransferase family protein [Actinoplanes sp. KI2]|uniref:MocR-like pyridoxine biosynthesis transcription factor PdxR n=1 Tax=Actinoplanes sp. KI2 TaxID=2983315 RepID=UPI0021D5A707|nr:PLP-dependent aminotransferase family protein [Actinoplanes sp. KI2]MCU7723507.1 PLP-dependent aminotransferase family protein [Actinoplanes sp. KI2]